jgi:hypothetical protein
VSDLIFLLFFTGRVCPNDLSPITGNKTSSIPDSNSNDNNKQLKLLGRKESVLTVITRAIK